MRPMREYQSDSLYDHLDDIIIILVFTIVIFLKLCGFIHISWLWIFAPIWVLGLIIIIGIIISILISLIIDIIEKIKEKKDERY